MVKYVYIFLTLAFIGFGWLVYILAVDLEWAAYVHGVIAAFWIAFFWVERWG